MGIAFTAYPLINNIDRPSNTIFFLLSLPTFLLNVKLGDLVNYRKFVQPISYLFIYIYIFLIIEINFVHEVCIIE